MSNSLGMIMLLCAVTLAGPALESFRHDLKEFLADCKRRRLRRKAAETNRLLYKVTREDYYRQRADELERG